MQLSELVKLLDADLVKPPLGTVPTEFEVLGVAPIDKAQAGQITFLTNPEYAKYASSCRAGAIIVAIPVADCPVPQIVHANPYYAFARTAQIFHKSQRSFSGVSSQAFVDPTAKLGSGVTIYPFAFIGAKSVIGDNTTIFSGVFVGDSVTIGKACDIRANAVIEYGCILGDRILVHGGAVIGADGFGFAPGENDIAKIPQVGIVRIADDVEIGPLCTIDRAAMGETKIGRGSKLDSQVHIAHNVSVGENCMLCGQAGIAGSAKLGNWITIAGQSGINSHVNICDHVTLGAMSAIVTDVDQKGTYMGFPAETASVWRRQLASTRRLPLVEKRLRAMEAAIAEMRKLVNPEIT